MFLVGCVPLPIHLLLSLQSEGSPWFCSETSLLALRSPTPTHLWLEVEKCIPSTKVNGMPNTTW